MKFTLILLVLLTLNQCDEDYSNPNQDETTQEDTTTDASGKPTGRRQHKPFT